MILINPAVYFIQRLMNDDQHLIWTQLDWALLYIIHHPPCQKSVFLTVRVKLFTKSFDPVAGVSQNWINKPVPGIGLRLLDPTQWKNETIQTMMTMYTCELQIRAQKGSLDTSISLLVPNPGSWLILYQFLRTELRKGYCFSSWNFNCARNPHWKDNTHVTKWR